MSAPFCKELEAKRMLDKTNIENFVPMHYKIIVKKDGKKVRELVPVIHNLIFVRTTPTMIREIKSRILILQYYTRREKGKNLPIIIPESQMRQFIAVSETHNEKLIYLKPEEVDLQKGTRVRIHGGSLDGVEGIFVKVRGIRNRRVVVQVEGIMVVAMAEIKPDLIEVLPQKETRKHLQLCV
ncbi:MAG: UpxY family transcription antiterminator [Tannerellaceae bacterium]|nr:UpxY family transcription antiterminator [Tannerellaceae bacterium]